MLTTRRAFAVVLTIAAAGGGYVAVRTAHYQTPRRAPDRPAWTEIAWPFASDQWGRGRAFRCRAAACGSEIDLYLRAKIGFCNCVSAIDDEEVDRVAGFDLMGREHAALAPGRPISVHGMEDAVDAMRLAGTALTEGRGSSSHCTNVATWSSRRPWSRATASSTRKRSYRFLEERDAGGEFPPACMPSELSWVLLTSLADMSTTSVVRRTKVQDCGFSVRPP